MTKKWKWLKDCKTKLYRQKLWLRNNCIHSFQIITRTNYIFFQNLNLKLLVWFGWYLIRKSRFGFVSNTLNLENGFECKTVWRRQIGNEQKKKHPKNVFFAYFYFEHTQIIACSSSFFFVLHLLIYSLLFCWWLFWIYIFFL